MCGLNRFFGPGTIRPSQIITTFGPGSIFDNLKDSFLIMGTGRWKKCKTLDDETLLVYLKKKNRFSRLREFRVPVSSHEDEDIIPIKTFPSWGVCQACHMLQPRDMSRGEDGTRCRSGGCTEGSTQNHSGIPKTIPVRFIAACENGHLEDFPWYRWIHQGAEQGCSTGKAEMYLEDNHNSLSLESKIVRCQNCGQSRTMGPALAPNGLRFAIPEGCHGRRPWLNSDDGGCTDGKGKQVYLRGLYKGSSNVYFPRNIRAITVPPFASPLAYRVIKILNTIEVPKQSALDRKLIPPLLPEADPVEVTEIVRAYVAKEAGHLDIRADEFRELNLEKHPSKGTDKGDFKTEPIELPENFSEYLENLVLVKKMREVVALTGFYRLEPLGADEGDTRKESPVTEAHPTWLPAVQNRGEGIFFSLKEAKINKWISRNPDMAKRFNGIARKSAMLAADDEMPSSPKYILLHTISHLLIREISNFAGYSLSSIRERIYAGDRASGILIYTSSPSSDGSLGGLVEQGKKPRFNIMLQRALRKASVCSMDPLCSFSMPGVENRRNGSACHACLFLPETSCERMNDLLDRALVQTTLSNRMGFFES